MATLLVKFTDESQYNALTSTITYTDTSPQRWIDVYSKLKSGDNCIFHSSSNKLYTGDFNSLVTNLSVTFINIRIVDITLDNLLRINKVRPEMLSVFKRPPGPIYRLEAFDINAIYNAATSKDFISFYIIKKESEAQILPTLKKNDRVVTIDKNGRLSELYSITNGVLNTLNLGNGYFNAKGKSLDELAALMVVAKKPNHVRNIKRIENALETTSSYKFPSFTDYYNIIHNKSLFSNNPITGGAISINNENQNHLENLPNNKNSMALNTILFGPPGTGKTFNSINKALKIINEEEEKELDWEDRKAVKNLFDKRVNEGRIVFTTFHQSMSYEDFIEGIKPEEPEKEGDPVIYKIKYGILRNLCIEASFEIAQLRDNHVTEEVLDFSILYDKFVEDIEEKLIEGKTVELEIKTGGRVLVDSISQQGNVIIKHQDGNRTYTVSKARLTKLQSAIKKLDDVGNINDEFRSIIGGSNSSAYWSVLNAIRKEKTFIPKSTEKRKYTFEEKKEVVLSLSKSDFKNKDGKPFVLIIDEINRGNVSQIFGELITLIEEDKRLGKEEGLEVTLPYSKDKFGVPANLYIIGTMNTADKSVEALDAALRRRFCFEEMKPKPYLIKTESKSGKVNGIVEGIDLEELLTTINTRIEKLIDKDHRIGHSYFLKVHDSTSLLHSFKNEIIPLLEEYFFGDFGKIGLVLGSSFVEKVNGNFSFAKFEEYDNDIQEDLKQKTVYKIRKESEWKFSEI